MPYDLSHQGSPALPLDVTIAFFLVYKQACDKKNFWSRIAICWWKQTNISLPVTITARDSYLPDKGCEYFRAGYKLTVGKWIPPTHVLLFASCGQCPQDSMKESLLFPPLTVRTMGAQPNHGRHRPLCRGRRDKGRQSDGEMPKGQSCVLVPSRQSSVWLHSFSYSVAQSGSILAAKCSVCIKVMLKKNIQRTSILKKTCQHVYVHKEKCGNELSPPIFNQVVKL